MMNELRPCTENLACCLPALTLAPDNYEAENHAPESKLEILNSIYRFRYLLLVLHSRCAVNENGLTNGVFP